MKRVLVPHDKSKASDFAFDKALDICAKLHARLFLLIVIGSQNSTAGMSSRMAREKLDELDSKSRLYLEKLKTSASKKKVRISIHTIRDPSESRGINRFVNENNIDLIVIVPRRRAKWKRAIFGSTTTKLLKNSNCHIMVLKKPKHQ